MTDIKLLILFFFVNALEIFGFYAATRYGELNDGMPDPDDREILWWINYWGKGIIGEFWMKPISNCPICMSSYHSLLFWIPLYLHLFPFIYIEFSFGLFYIHALYVLALAGFNKLIVSLNFIDL